MKIPEFEHLLYSEAELNAGVTLQLTKEEAKHLSAIRKHPGDTDIFLTNGKGLLAKAQLLSKTGKKNTLQILSVTQFHQEA